MEGGGGVGPTTANNSHSRPIRASSRSYYSLSSSSPATTTTTSFSGPVRRWEKKWVHVSPSPPSTTTKKHPKPSSNGSRSSTCPLFLCKWTPLSRSSADAGDTFSGELPRRKFRYTPIVVFEEQRKRAGKRGFIEDKSGEMHQSTKRFANDSDDIYGMLDINIDLMGAHQESNKKSSAQYSSRSDLNLGLYSENQLKDSQLDMVNLNRF